MRTSLPAIALLLPLVACNAAAPDDSAQRSEEMGWTGVLSEEEFKNLHTLTDRAVPALNGEWIDIDGVRAYLSLPPGLSAPMPAVVVIHEWWGLNEHIQLWTDRVAAEGYAALAIDLYAGEVALERDEALAMVQAVDPVVALQTVQRAYRFLVEDPRIQASRTASLGWCFGGGWSLQLALVEPDLDACVIYYGRLVTSPEDLEPLQAELFGVFGSRDTGIPPDKVADFAEALKGAGKSHTVRNFDAEHAFANPSSARYDPEAASAAWDEVRAFLARTLRGSS